MHGLFTCILLVLCNWMLLCGGAGIDTQGVSHGVGLVAYLLRCGVGMLAGAALPFVCCIIWSAFMLCSTRVFCGQRFRPPTCLSHAQVLMVSIWMHGHGYFYFVSGGQNLKTLRLDRFCLLPRRLAWSLLDTTRLGRAMAAMAPSVLWFNNRVPFCKYWRSLVNAV